MLIDFHTHCFPDALAEKAVSKLAGIASIPYYSDGTVSSELAVMDRAGVDCAVVCNIATNVRQQRNVNRFAVMLHQTQPRLYALGSIHPDSPYDETCAELDRLRAAGIPGIKAHPDYMEAFFDDPRFLVIFEECARRGLFVVTHSGYDFYSPDLIHATPDRILKVHRALPELKIVAAHFGGNLLYDDVISLLCGEDIWFDLSLLAVEKPDVHKIRRLIDAHSPDRLLFASDLPWCDPLDELNALEALGLDDERMEKIRYKNAAGLLRIPKLQTRKN